MAGYLANKPSANELEEVVQRLNNTKVENGFLERSDSTISFDDLTRTFTIAPTGSQFQFKSGTTLYTKQGQETVVTSDTEGLHFIYYDEFGVLTNTTTFSEDLITFFALVAVVYWNVGDAESVIVADERHGASMAGGTHLYLHNTRRARLGRRGPEGVGFELSGLTVDGNGDLDASIQGAVTDGIIWDEDLEFVFTDGNPQDLSPTAQIPMIYRDGAGGNWNRIASTGYLVATTGTGRAAWNEFTGTAWQISEVGNNDFVLVHFFATTDVRHPIIGVLGQAEYLNAGQARAGAEIEIRDLSFGSMAVLTAEFSPLATIIVQTSDGYSNGAKSRIRSTDDGDSYLDWRLEEITAVLEEA